MLDKVQDPASNGATTLQLGLGASFTSGRRVDLTAAGLTSTGGITPGGQTVQPDGSLPAPSSTAIGLSGKCLSVTGGSIANGALADIYTCNGSASENWAHH